MKRLAFGVPSFLVGLVTVGAIYEAVSFRAVVARSPPPGRMVDVGGRRLHLDCRGSGSPIVILEAGLDIGGSIDWSAVHQTLAGTTRVCAYDRAGIMWSEASPAARRMRS